MTKKKASEKGRLSKEVKQAVRESLDASDLASALFGQLDTRSFFGLFTSLHQAVYGAPKRAVYMPDLLLALRVRALQDADLLPIKKARVGKSKPSKVKKKDA